ncbi:hypothetical protein SAMN02745824_2424 [Parasphingorhabdus marina DSM 22363]|uniref:Amidohydrolase-related domain-containing protein n=1 Tax=Parasphingorhabdus marina DSM 22363 TaxID=1123272 RepID=A0A1N6FJS6_9SPHN|nr:amidohydrolase family protein [Parasphingorhabdus marina]SIN95518.1 hypothetical protein SAMN02745824_2424 [Parasphingorhabdus marina DSM 22363]
MHLHAPMADSSETPDAPATTLAKLADNNIVLALVSITSPEQAESWHAVGRDRFLLGAMMPCPENLAPSSYVCFPETKGLPDIAWLEQSIRSGMIEALHEMMFNYDGSLPDDPKMAPYWALAKQWNIPVGVHTWSGPPPGKAIRRNPDCCPLYDRKIGNPRNLRPVLDRHPDLKIWLQHVGSDGSEAAELWRETIALLTDYPNVYVDLSITNSMLPVTEYEAALMRLINAGFGDRIMLGTDNVPLQLILDRMDEIDGLSDRQKQAILYDNAANFLELSPETRRRHHMAE